MTPSEERIQRYNQIEREADALGRVHRVKLLKISHHRNGGSAPNSGRSQTVLPGGSSARTLFVRQTRESSNSCAILRDS